MMHQRVFVNVSVLIIVMLISLACSNIKNRVYFPDYGSLLWVNEAHSDTVVKKVVDETLDYSTIIIAQVPWTLNDSTSVDNINWYCELARSHGKKLMVNIDWLSNTREGPRGNWSFTELEVKDEFRKYVLTIVEKYKPEMLTLGIEVNYYALTNPNGYTSFVLFYNSLKKELFNQYPDIKVGLSFQLELLFGVDIEWDQVKTLETLDAVAENLDYIGISTYPDLYKIDDKNTFILSSFIDTLDRLYDIPMGITETGVSSIKFDCNQRKEYIRVIFDKVEKLNMSFLVWGSMVDDPRDDEWMHRIGLIDSDGTHKCEFDGWGKNVTNKY
jgi:hypothetical protein